MPYKERPIEKKYHSIGDVAKMFGVATSLIRFWEDEFDIIQPKKNKKGHRIFTKDDIESIKLIYHLVKEQGYKIKSAKEIIENKKEKTEDKLEMIESLQKVRAFLIDLRDKMDN